MFKTSDNTGVGGARKMAVTTDRLMEYLDCGRLTAVKIGEAAGGRIKIGKRVLWNLRKIQDYVDALDNETAVISGLEGSNNDTQQR